MTANRPRTRDILRTAFETLRRHPRLLWFPLLSAVVSAVMFGIGVAIAQLAGVVAADPAIELGLWSLLADPTPAAEVTIRRGWITGGAMAGLSVQLCTMVFAVALSYATMEAMAGREWSCGGAVRHALRRFGPIATVSVIATGTPLFMGVPGKKLAADDPANNFATAEGHLAEGRLTDACNALDTAYRADAKPDKAGVRNVEAMVGECFELKLQEALAAPSLEARDAPLARYRTVSP